MAIEVLNLEPWFSGGEKEKSLLAEKTNAICHETGFFYISNHGISDATCADYIGAMKTFFALPVEVKAGLDKANSPQFRGWEQLGSELTNNTIDYREQIDIGVDRPVVKHPDPYYLALLGPNQWPDEHLAPGFRETVTDFIDRLSELSRTLLRIMSRSLGLNEDHMEIVFGENPSPYTKLIRYPKTEAGGQGVGIHKDSGFLTLLLQDEHSGLEAQTNYGSWEAVDPIPGTFVVNTGELLQMVTHNYFIATPHRVMNRESATRYSSAFFYSPDLLTRLDPLPIDAKYIEKARQSDRHRSEGLMASRAEMQTGVSGMDSHQRQEVFGERYWQRWIRSYPEIARKYYPEHVT